jgi:16S rRNA (cytidine1402-2'-O)-methyltransferase
MTSMAGTLFVVATPIGNLEDLSFRALRTLKEVDLIAAEDTRRTAKLLAHYRVSKSMLSLHAHNEHREAAKVIARLKAGQSVALVSDAGTPGISDPGQFLVREAHRHQIRVSPIPGPSAVAAALSTTGLNADQFAFLGYPPRSGTDRSEWFEELRLSPRTVVFFEAPHRISRTLADLAAYLVNRQIFVHREISKIHEELVEYTNTSLEYTNDHQGEFVFVVEADDSKQRYLNELDSRIKLGLDMLDCLTKNNCVGSETALEFAARASSVTNQDLRKASKKARIAAGKTKDRLS